jgi:hypothetical protein
LIFYRVQTSPLVIIACTLIEETLGMRLEIVKLSAKNVCV